MKIEPIEPKPPAFGIYKGHRKTDYGQYTWGEYKNQKIEVFDALEKCNQKLHYVSDKKLLNWIKSKLIYFDNGIKKIIRSNAR